MPTVIGSQATQMQLRDKKENPHHNEIRETSLQ